MASVTAQAIRTRRSPDSWLALILSVLVIAAGSLGLAGVGRTAEALVYSYALDPGTTRVYAMTSKATFTPKGIPGVTDAITEDISGKMTMKVAEVADDGSTLFEFTLSDVKATGIAAGDVPTDSFKMRVSKSGEILKLDGPAFGGVDVTQFLGVDGEGEGAIGGSNMLPVFPSEKIRPGDTWTESDDVPLPFGNSKMRFTATGKHLGFVDSPPYGETARMIVNLKAPLDLSFSFKDILGAVASDEPIPAELEQARIVMTGSMRGATTARVIPETGDLIASVMTMKMNIGMRFEGLPAVAAAGFPASFTMVGDMLMKLTRTA